MLSQIQNIGASGYINQVNDAVVGMPTAPGGTGASRFAGQLGQRIQLSDNMLKYLSSVGVVYGGEFQYVRLAAAAAVPVVGQIVFWDISVADSLYQVTTSESGSSDAGMFAAGIILSTALTPGYYTYIQRLGPTFVQFRGTLTSVGAAGSRVYAAAAGGADLGFADVLSSANPTLFSDVSLMQGRYLGTAVQAPTNGGLDLVNLDIQIIRP